MRVAESLAAAATLCLPLALARAGKPISYSRAADIPLACDHFRYFSGW